MPTPTQAILFYARNIYHIPDPINFYSQLHPTTSTTCTALCMVLQGRMFSCNSIRKYVLDLSNARDRVKIINNDIISRAAIKQVNCHALRAKISNYPLSPWLSVLMLELPESQLVNLHFPLVQSYWQVCSMGTSSNWRGLKQPWCLVYRSRYVNMFYTIKLFSILKNKSLKSISFFFS